MTELDSWTDHVGPHAKGIQLQENLIFWKYYVMDIHFLEILCDGYPLGQVKKQVTLVCGFSNQCVCVHFLFYFPKKFETTPGLPISKEMG